MIERSVVMAAEFRGPLPEPSDYAKYGQVEPSAPERILAQWEAESAHRRAYEMKALDAAIQSNSTGLRNALVFAIAALGAAVAAMHFGMQAAAVTIGGGTIVAGIGVFIYQQRKAPTSTKGSTTSDDGAQPPAKR